MKRMALFLLANLAVLVMLGTVVRLLGVDRYLTQEGLDLSTCCCSRPTSASAARSFPLLMSDGLHRALWFAAEFGSTQCREITRCNFSGLDDVGRYIDSGDTARCVALAERVERAVQGLVAGAAAAGEAPLPQAHGAAR
jgi:hypothetical protein